MTNSWNEPPKLRVGEESVDQPRHATWLELFYDLVFVVAVAQVTHELTDNTSIPGYLGFVVLFIPIWWAWVGTTFYSNRFDTDNVIQRLLMGLQMLAVAAMAVNVHYGLGKSAPWFALAYAVSRLILVVEYIWAGWAIPRARKLVTYYSIGFTAGAVCWLISVVTPAPWRFGLWAVGLAIDFITPLAAQQHQRELPPHAEHLPERFGLFTIIVLGEAILAVVNGVAEVEWTIANGLSAGLGFLVAFGLWWLYFGNVSGLEVLIAQKSGRYNVAIWLYVHLPLLVGLAATGVGVEHVIASPTAAALHDPERWVLCGSAALCYLSLFVIHRTGMVAASQARAWHRLWAAGLLLAIAAFGHGLAPLTVVTITALTGVVQVVLDLVQGQPQGPTPTAATNPADNLHPE